VYSREHTIDSKQQRADSTGNRRQQIADKRQQAAGSRQQSRHQTPDRVEKGRVDAQVLDPQPLLFVFRGGVIERALHLS
jgi:uncharacterized protein YjbJ (UPF0337 family)